jgi:hypothetical protein
MVFSPSAGAGCVLKSNHLNSVGLAPASFIDSRLLAEAELLAEEWFRDWLAGPLNSLGEEVVP